MKKLILLSLFILGVVPVSGNGAIINISNISTGISDSVIDSNCIISSRPITAPTIVAHSARASLHSSRASLSGESAPSAWFVSSKDTGREASVSVVPIPTPIWLFGWALVSLFVLGRRKSV